MSSPKRERAAVKIQSGIRQFLCRRRVHDLNDRREFSDRVMAAVEEANLDYARLLSVRVIQRLWRIALARRFVAMGLRQMNAALQHIEDVEETAIFRAADVGLDTVLPPQHGALAEVQWISVQIGQSDLPYLNILGGITVDAQTFERNLLETHWELPVGIAYLLTSRNPTREYPGIELLLQARASDSGADMDSDWGEPVGRSGRRYTWNARPDEASMLKRPVPTFSTTVQVEAAVSHYQIPKCLSECEQRLAMLRRLVVLKKVIRVQRWWKRVYAEKVSERYLRAVKHLSVFNECASRIQMWWKNGCSPSVTKASKDMLYARLALMEERLSQEQTRVEQAKKQKDLRELWFAITKHPARSKGKGKVSPAEKGGGGGERKGTPSSTGGPSRSFNSSTGSAMILPPVRTTLRRPPAPRGRHPIVDSGRYLPDAKSTHIPWNRNIIKIDKPWGDGLSHAGSTAFTLKSTLSNSSAGAEEPPVPFSVLWRERYWPVKKTLYKVQARGAGPSPPDPLLEHTRAVSNDEGMSKARRVFKKSM